MMKNRMLGNFLVALAVALVLTACGGGGGTGTDPKEDNTGTDDGGVVEEGVPAQVTGVSFLPRNGDGVVTWDPVSGATSYSVYWHTSTDPEFANMSTGATSPYTIGPLVNGTRYYIWVRATNDAGSSPWSSIVSGTPTAPVSGWGAATELRRYDSYYADFTEGEAAINADALGATVWMEEYWAGFKIYGAAYVNGAWSPAKAISDFGALNPQLAVSANGDVMAVWEQENEDSSIQSIYAAHYISATNVWSTPEAISTNLSGTDAWVPDVQLDSSGNAMVVWRLGGQLWARYYDVAAGWDATEQMISNGSIDVGILKLTGDGSGAFTAVWREGPSPSTVYARRYSNGTWEATQRPGWAAADLAEGESVVDFAIDGNATGAISVLWIQSRADAGGTTYDLDASHYDFGTDSWSAPQTIVSESEQPSDPGVAIDAMGNVMAVWRKVDGTTSSVQAAQYGVTGATWGSAATVDATGTGQVDRIVLDMDGSGNAQVLWFQNGFYMESRRFDATGGTGWGSPTSVLNDSYGGNVALSPNGRGLMVGAGTSLYGYAKVWAMVYTP